MRSPKAPPAPDPKTQVSGIEDAAKRRTVNRMAANKTGAGQTQLQPRRLLQPAPIGMGAYGMKQRLGAAA